MPEGDAGRQFRSQIGDGASLASWSPLGRPPRSSSRFSATLEPSGGSLSGGSLSGGILGVSPRDSRTPEWSLGVSARIRDDAFFISSREDTSREGATASAGEAESRNTPSSRFGAGRKLADGLLGPRARASRAPEKVSERGLGLSARISSREDTSREGTTAAGSEAESRITPSSRFGAGREPADGLLGPRARTSRTPEKASGRDLSSLRTQRASGFSSSGSVAASTLGAGVRWGAGDERLSAVCLSPWESQKDLDMQTADAAALLAKGVKGDALDRFGDTAMHKTVRSNKISILKEILKSQPNINVPGQKKRTPLHEAALAGHSQCAAELLVAGADGQLLDGAGKSVRDVAIKNNHQQIVNLIDTFYRLLKDDVKNEEAEEAQQQNLAATRIQALQRGKKQRKELAEQQRAATRIQAVQRGTTARRQREAAVAAAAAVLGLECTVEQGGQEQPQEEAAEQEQDPLPAGWEVGGISRTTGKTYYINNALQLSQYERPQQPQMTVIATAADNDSPATRFEKNMYDYDDSPAPLRATSADQGASTR